MRVLIIEPHLSGHHASYLRWLVGACRQGGFQVVIATSLESDVRPELQAILSEHDGVVIRTFDRIDVPSIAVRRTFSLMARDFRYWQWFKRAVAGVRRDLIVDRIIIPYADYCFFALGILGAPFGGIPWCGITMRLAHTPASSRSGNPPPWKWQVAKRMLGRTDLTALFVINPSVNTVPVHWIPESHRRRLRYLPDPSDFVEQHSRVDARIRFGIPPSAVAILVFGSLDDRKGVPRLIEALASCSDFRKFVLVLAGKQSPTFDDEIHTDSYDFLTAESRIIEINRVLTKDERDAVVTASDVVWVGYRNHQYMSGVLVLAGRAGKPVVGTNEGEIGQLITAHGLGAVAGIDDLGEVIAALDVMLDDDLRRAFGAKSRDAFAGHTVEEFSAKIIAALHPTTGADHGGT